MLIAKTVAVASLSLLANDIPLQARLMHGHLEGCEMSAHTAKSWRANGDLVIEQKLGDWCVSGKVANGHWIAEQWQQGISPDRRSRGWLIHIPLAGLSKGALGHSRRIVSPWQLDIFDLDIKTRIRYRQSFSDHDTHHRKTLSETSKTGLVITRAHPDSGTYSVVIEQGGRP